MMDGSVMVVEVNEADREQLIANLRMADYRVWSTSSVEQARSILGSMNFDVLLIGADASDLYSLVLCSEARDRCGDGIVIIIAGQIEGETQPQQAVTALEVGADDFVAKPVMPEELLARISSHIRRRRWYSQGICSRPPSIRWDDEQPGKG